MRGGETGRRGGGGGEWEGKSTLSTRAIPALKCVREDFWPTLNAIELSSKSKQGCKQEDVCKDDWRVGGVGLRGSGRGKCGCTYQSS